MSWNSEYPDRFPAEVRQFMLAPGDTVRGEYTIIEPLCVNGTELCYHAQQLSSGIDCLLFELIPLRWSTPDENGRFMPYHDEAAAQWEIFRRSALSRLSRLQDFANEAAVPAVKDGFEEGGTIWYVTRYEESVPLHQLIQEKQLEPKDAVRLMAPLLDTLAGLHDAEMYHGAITDSTIRLVGEEVQLRGWLSAGSLAEACAQDDVRAVSEILWKMTTGSSCYQEDAAAALPAAMRTAIYNGLNDPEMTIAKLWKQLHAKKPAKRSEVQVMHSQRRSILARLFNPVVTAVFCVCCLAAPVLLWRMDVLAMVTETPAEPMEDVAYTLHENEMQMPELLYLDQAEAQKLVEDMGLSVILATRQDNPVIPENQVLLQSPDAGAVVKPGDTVTLTVSDGWANFVPDLSGMPQEQAKKTLEELGFTVQTEEKISPDDAPGTVISQSVAPDTRLERESSITLTVSLGREDLDVTQLITVEDYVGQDFERVKAQLTEQFLYAVALETVYDPNTAAGTILKQDVQPGKQTAQGSVINFTVSKGVETVRVPDVVHLNADSAKQTLNAANLQCIICYISNAEWQMDTVLTQNTEAGSLVPVGSQVWLEVSIGTGSVVESTGGWSGNPLPTFSTEETTEETEENTEESDSIQTTSSQYDSDETDDDESGYDSSDDEDEDEDEDEDDEEYLTAPPMPYVDDEEY